MKALVCLAVLTAGAAQSAETGGQGRTAPLAAPFAYDPLPSTYRPLPREDVLIVGATLLDGVGGRMADADILLREGKIANIGSNLARSNGVKVIEAAGRWVTPGLIDIHTHDGTYTLPIVYEDPPTWDVTEVSNPNVAETSIDHAINARDPAFMMALAGGVTTLQVLPGSTPLFGGRSVVLKNVPARTLQEMKFPDAPQGLKMACGENPKSAFGSKGQAPTSRQGEVAMMRTAWISARDYRRKWDRYHAKGARDHNQVRDRDHDRAPKDHDDDEDPPARDLELDTLAAVLRGELRVHLHCYSSDDIAVMLAIASEFGFRIAAIHHAVEAYKVADLLAAAKVCAAVWPDWWGFKMEAFDGIRENAAFVDAAGGCAVMHSDSPFIGQRLALEAAKAMAAGRRAGLDLTRERSIAWVTSNAARALGLDDRIGRLALGYNADVVVWSADPFSIYSKADQVYVDGALAYDRADPDRQPESDLLIGHPAREPKR
jgi:imidazolonepropionase-like amidohydrolase